MIPLHLGSLHPYETALTLVLAFGPFVLLGVVAWLRRREDDRLDQQEEPEADAVRPASRRPPAPGS